MDDVIKKAAQIEGGRVDAEQLALINKQTLRQLNADEVFAFRIAACGNQIDRDFERFTDQTLNDLAKLYVGKTMIMDHQWSAANQTARIYASEVEDGGNGVRNLVLRAYMMRNAQTKPIISAIEGGILREVSVGCAVKRQICSICGAVQQEAMCSHFPGRKYDGEVCYMDLDGAEDAYEVSFVAVPAQKDAGVIKRYEGKRDAVAAAAAKKEEFLQAQALLELEERRYGGLRK